MAPVDQCNGYFSLEDTRKKQPNSSEETNFPDSSTIFVPYFEPLHI